MIIKGRSFSKYWKKNLIDGAYKVSKPLVVPSHITFPDYVGVKNQ